MTRVESTGLALAAEATGAVAMPLNEPGRSSGRAAQPAPKVWAPASDVVRWCCAGRVGGRELLSLPPQAARPREAPSAIAAIPVRRSVVFMVPLPVWWNGHLVFGAGGRSGRAVRVGDSGHATTRIFWMPEAPSGNGVARAAVWTLPSRSVARLEIWCGPGLGVPAQVPLAPVVVAGARAERGLLPGPAVDLHLDPGDADGLGPGDAADEGPARLHVPGRWGCRSGWRS